MTHHTGRHLTLWLLFLGVFCLTLPSQTADLNAVCQSLAAGKFQIRAMTYTTRYFYLLSSDGQLFIENVAPFLAGIQQDPPTIELSKPTFSLSTNWRGVSDPVDYANSKLHFGFTADDSSSDRPTLRLIKYECLQRDCSLLNMCVHRGFMMNGREAPVRFEASNNCTPIAPADKPVFWLNDHFTMYPICLQVDGGVIMVITPDNAKIQKAFLQVDKWNTKLANVDMGTLKESPGKPQSGLLTEDVLFIANQDSTGHFLLVDKSGSGKTLATYSQKLPLREVSKLAFCQIEPPVEAKVDADSALPDLIKEPVKDAAKPKKSPPNQKILYLALAGTVLIVLAFAVYAVMKWQKKKKKKKKPTKKSKKSKKRDKASKRSRFWCKIGALLAKVSPCMARKLNQREIVMSKVRQSVMLTSMAAASKRRKRGSKVGPASRAAVSGVLTEMQEGLLAFKALMRQPKPKPKPFSMACTASTASTASKASRASKASQASLASLPAETQSLDYHF